MWGRGVGPQDRNCSSLILKLHRAFTQYQGASGSSSNERKHNSNTPNHHLSLSLKDVNSSICTLLKWSVVESWGLGSLLVVSVQLGSWHMTFQGLYIT